MTKYNWGIIGTGWIAHDMADALNKTNGEIYAAANPNEAHLTEFVKEKNVKHAYVNPYDMIADENIDIIAQQHALRIRQESARSGQERFLRKIADGQRQRI